MFKKVLRSLFTVLFRPFAGPHAIRGSHGPWGEGDPGKYYGNG